MNEETETTETIAAIVAEMRREAGAQTNPSPLYRYADRIEAAAERKARAREQAAADYALKRGEDAPGNVAAMREALERIVRYEDGIVGCIESGHASGVDWDGITFAMIQTAKEALAAPARNCDVGTARGQIDRFNDFCFNNAPSCPGCPLYQNLNNYEEHGFGRNECMSFWGQLPYAPAEGGDHA